MLLSNRRKFLLGSFCLIGCGYTPVRGKNSKTKELLGSIFVQDPKNRAEFELVRNLEKQFAERPIIEGGGSNFRPIPKLINLLKSMGVTNPNHFSYRLLVYILYVLFTKPMEDFYVFCKNFFIFIRG